MSTQLESIGGQLYLNGKKVTLEGDGGATAWCYVDGGATPVLQASYNIASVVRQSTGLHVVTFTTPMDNAFYSTVITCGQGNVYGAVNNLNKPQTVNGFEISILIGSTAGVIDPPTIQVAVFGGKA